jgi:hypothetical protein
MKNEIKTKIETDLKNLLAKDVVVSCIIDRIFLRCFVNSENGENIHIISGVITSKGVYLKSGFTHLDYRRQGIAQSVRESIHSVLKEENKGVLYTDSKEFIDPAKTPDNISPLYELWEKLVTEGKAEKQGNEYTMI